MYKDIENNLNEFDREIVVQHTKYFFCVTHPAADANKLIGDLFVFEFPLMITSLDQKHIIR